MSNERKTEELVRAHLRELDYYSESVVVEEQQSENPQFRKLLKYASKRGLGIGRPEFIIHSSKHPGFVIVIECKAETRMHESPSRSKPEQYAVDGALLYASYLSKTFDVIAVAVSGQTKKGLRISHFLWLAGEERHHDFAAKSISSFDDYYRQYITSSEKFNQDYSSLLAYSKELNKELQKRKIPESKRSLLISAILIALKNKAFRNGFRGHRTARQLTTSIVQTVLNELEDSEVPPANIERLKYAYSFIKNYNALTQDKAFMEALIDEIDGKINRFLETHEYFDALGQFYIEFLRYANNDKGLGIVLTPPHITELFTELAEIGPDSVVFDNCCGTGGFLISAMKKLVKEAAGDSRKIRRIKSKQLAGIEFSDEIYALAVSNMIIHGDGKTNIKHDDCFSCAPEIAQVFRPDVGFLNPPYKSQKEDVEELEFILNNLETISRGGVCIGIIPMSCVLAQSGPSYELKRKLLERHTLEGVMSMPNDLFHNSKVAVVTSVIVLRAHVPHANNKKTWLGYWKDDGFIVSKHRGRRDSLNQWAAKKNQWVQAFLNRDVVRGLSVMRKLTENDEWCAEAFIETNYGTLNEERFREASKRYVVFAIENEGLVSYEEFE